MSALIAGFLLVGYLLAPGAIYRLIFSFSIPAKRFQRTRTEEIVFSVLVTCVPFVLSALLLRFTPVGRWPAFQRFGSKQGAYASVLTPLLPGGDAIRSPIYPAYVRALCEQGRFLAWLWLFCAAEGWCAGRLMTNFGDSKQHSWQRWIGERVLLQHVSEWQILFTTFALPKQQKRYRVEMDALATSNVLYRGRLANWFTDATGKLTGVYLTHAQRFERDKLAKDREQGIIHPKNSYWRIIGGKLYLDASTLANYNIRYEESLLEEDLLEEDFKVIKIPPGDGANSSITLKSEKESEELDED